MLMFQPGPLGTYDSTTTLLPAPVGALLRIAGTAATGAGVGVGVQMARRKTDRDIVSGAKTGSLVGAGVGILLALMDLIGGQ